jgi:hypothetical protein
MRKAAVAELEAWFRTALRPSQERPVAVTRHGKLAADLLFVDDEEEMERLIAACSPKW